MNLQLSIKFNEYHDLHNDVNIPFIVVIGWGCHCSKYMNVNKSYISEERRSNLRWNYCLRTYYLE